MTEKDCWEATKKLREETEARILKLEEQVAFLEKSNLEQRRELDKYLYRDYEAA